MTDEPVVGVVPNFSEGRNAEVIDAIVSALQVPGRARRLRGGRPRPQPSGHDRARRSRRGRRERDGGRRGGGASDRHVRASRRSSTDGRGRRDPVHAGARRDHGRVRLAGTRLRPRAGGDAGRARLPVRPGRALARAGRRWPRSARASSRVCARPSPAASACPTSGRTRSGGRGRPRSAPASRSWRSTSTSTAPTRRRPRRSRAACASRRAACPALRAIAFAVPERGGIVTVSMNLVDHEVTGLRAAFDAVTERAAGHDLRIVGERDRGSRARVGARARRRGVPSPPRVRPGPARSWSGCWSPRRQGVRRDGRTIGEQERGGVPRGPGLGRPDAGRGRGRGDRRCDGRGADRDGRPAHRGQGGVRGPGGSDARVGGDGPTPRGPRSWSSRTATRMRSTA